MKITKITDSRYAFSKDGFEFFASVHPNSGAWNIESFNASQFGPIQQRPASLAHSQVSNFLRQTPLYIRTNKINGATNKRIFERNKAFS